MLRAERDIAHHWQRGCKDACAALQNLPVGSAVCSPEPRAIALDYEIPAAPQVLVSKFSLAARWNVETMGSRRKTTIKAVYALACCAFWLLASREHHVRAQTTADLRDNLVVIVAADSGTRTMTFTDVRNIFLGVATYAPNGEPYIPLVQLAKTPVRVAFDAQFLGLDPEASGRYWVDQRIRGRRTPPRTIPSVELLRRVVAAMPGAVGYVRADELRPGVIPIKIDGIDFRSPNYQYRISQVHEASTARFATR